MTRPSPNALHYYTLDQANPLITTLNGLNIEDCAVHLDLSNRALKIYETAFIAHRLRFNGPTTLNLSHSFLTGEYPFDQLVSNWLVFICYGTPSE